MNLSKVKQLAATALGTVLPLEYILKVSRRRYILAYHRVLPDDIARRYRMQDSMWVSVNTFNNDISWIRKRGDIVDLDTILDFSTPNKRPLFSITFDDGWVDNYEYAFPILKQHKAPATIFLVTNAIETGHLFWVEDFLYKIAELSGNESNDSLNDVLLDFYRKAGAGLPIVTDTRILAEGLAEVLKPLPVEDRTALLSRLYQQLGIDSEPLSDQILKWQDIKEMSKYGIEFGSHTHTHEILRYADDDIILDELLTSKRIIEEKTGKAARYFCYPNARYRSDNAAQIKQAGYTGAFRIHNLCVKEHQDRYFIPRYLLNEKVSANKNYLLCRLLNLPKF